MKKNKLPAIDIKPAQMKSFLEGLFAGIGREKEVALKEIIDLLVPKATIENIDHYNLFIAHELEYAMESALAKNYPGCKKHNIAFLFINHTFVQCNIERVISKYEGSCCICDKSHWLMRAMAQYFVDGKEFDMTIGEKCFWKPHFGTAGDWQALVDGLIDLYYGNPAGYLIAFKALIEAGDAKAKEAKEAKVK